MNKIKYLQMKFKSDEQGSDNWLQGRKWAFGGSEMASVLGTDPYKNLDDVIATKRSMSNHQTDATQWGHLFEPVAKEYLKKIYGTIYEFGSIPHCRFPVVYSPDGIICDKNDDLHLIEIKAPIMRGIKKIPAQYLEQVKTGMCVLPVEDTHFWQFRFRRCPLTYSPKSNKYDRWYHKEFKSRQKDMSILSFGYLHWDNKSILTDLSLSPVMIGKIPKGKPTIIIDIDTKFESGVVLMFKLFEMEKTIVEMEPDYLTSKQNLLWELHKKLMESIEKEP